MIRRAVTDDNMIAVRVTPNAKMAAIALGEDDEGRHSLAIRVTVPPEDGKANDAVITLLAKALGIRKSALTIVQGETNRNKVIRIKE